MVRLTGGPDGFPRAIYHHPNTTAFDAATHETMKKEIYAIVLITVAFFSGMILTAATSGCDTASDTTVQSDSAVRATATSTTH